MHPVLANYVLKILRNEPEISYLAETYSSSFFRVLTDPNILGPISLSKALKLHLPQNIVTDSLIHKLNVAIKQLDSKNSNSPLATDIALILSQTHASEDSARASLLKNNGDIVNSILELSMSSTTSFNEFSNP
jgi:NACalpha-BTF3-like transcription factor